MMSNGSEDDDSLAKPLGRCSVLYYGVGHMLNDITAACWFTYLLLFLTEIGLSPRDAAIVMLSGQVADGFTTVFAGELIDRFGHFKVWHGAGSILVAISFSSVFGGCLPCKIFATSSSTLQTVGYSTFAAIFNVGWAATQVSHMSMVNCITLNSTSRVVLNSCRNACSMVANLTLYGVALIIFAVSKGTTNADVENQYRWIAYSSIIFGCCFVGIFHLGTKEPRSRIGAQGTLHARIAWAYWFKRVLYYQVALVYVLTRLVVNVSQAYLAFYVINELRMAQSAKALVPAIIYISSFIVSVILQEIAWTGQRLKAYYCAGGILWIFCGAAILILPRSMSAFMYFISIFIGIANALMMGGQMGMRSPRRVVVYRVIIIGFPNLAYFWSYMYIKNGGKGPAVTGISMQNVLIGQSLGGCAFVCGSLSFLDKMSCGLALYVLQSFQSCSPELHFTNSIEVYFSATRFGLGLLPPVCSLVGVAVTYTMKLHTPFSKPIMEPLLE